MLIEGRELVKDFRVKGGLLTGRATLRAVDRVSLGVAEGETVALVGESGSGKSTLGRLLLGLAGPSAGQILYQGQDIANLTGTAKKRFRAEVQVVFQDGGSSLNPRRTVGASLEVPLRYNRHFERYKAQAEAAILLERVGLDPAVYYRRYPHELSGGQRQRIGLARAIASKPRFVVADEPVSALDVSVRAQILKLMLGLQKDEGLAYLFITHDLGVVRAVASRVLVMYLGALVEEGPVAAVFGQPAHPYTRILLAATPLADPTKARQHPRQPLKGDIPSPLNVPSGCRFHTRCPLVQDICRVKVPPLVTFPNGQQAACHFAIQSASSPNVI